MHCIKNTSNTKILLATAVKIKHVPGQRTRSWNFEVSERTEKQRNVGITGWSFLYPVSWLIIEDIRERLIYWTSGSGNDVHSLRYHDDV